MIVCVCKNINSQQISASLEAGARSVEEVRADTGASSGCGKCQFRVNSLVQNYLSEDEKDMFYDAAIFA